MKNFSNTYIFTFSAVMVVLVALLLSLAAMQLKPFQDKNIEIEKMQNILASIKVNSTPANAQELYKKYVTSSFAVNTSGEKNTNVDAFHVDMKAEMAKPEEKRTLPVFISKLDNGEEVYIVPLRGKGLWGPIWGYISFKKDLNTIYSTFFDHQGETPGLGAEIKEHWFQEEFNDKKIFDESGKFVSIEVVKGGAQAGNPHQVDAISGGTITSKGLEEMVKVSLGDYKVFFEKNRQ
ncbi:MAG TPA: NADH:ubiquinone reductase (Na(+)-transporting) subunit C [Bacteroidales bacterium]|nr:NADH:ubiquinone reductase (Na(+)-transporting) subunit C [Bacteroidales bacterium]